MKQLPTPENILEQFKNAGIDLNELEGRKAARAMVNKLCHTKFSGSKLVGTTFVLSTKTWFREIKNAVQPVIVNSAE